MSKSNIPICKLPEEDCNILFKSIIDKLKIENPTFVYPIYKKIVNSETTNTTTQNNSSNLNIEDLQNCVLDSKYKCKQILEKVIDSDDDEVFDTDEEDLSSDENEKDVEKDVEKSKSSTSEILNSDSDCDSGDNGDSNCDSNCDMDEKENRNILNDKIKDTPIEDDDNN